MASDQIYSVIGANRNFDNEGLSKDFVYSCSWVFNPWAHVYRKYIQITPELIRSSGLTEHEFKLVYVKFINSPADGDQHVFNGLYHSATVKLRNYLSKQIRFYA